MSLRKGIVHIVQRMAPGGIETLVLDLVRTGTPDDRVFSLEGTTTQLLTQWPALHEIEDRLIGLGRRPGVSPFLPLQLASELIRRRPSAVFAHHIGPLLYGGIAARLACVPRVVHVEHDVWHYADAHSRKLAQRLDRIIQPMHVAVSHEIASELRGILGGSSVAVITNGVDLDRYRPGDRAVARRRLGIDPTRPAIISAGRLVAVKGHDILVRAARSLPLDTLICIAGDGSERAALERLAEELGVTDRVRFLGHRDDLPDLLPAFDVFCLPSRAEGLPRGVIEAQACGLPVVASNVGALPEAVCTRTGALVPPGDADALADALTAVLKRPLAATPRNFVEMRFSFTETIAAYRNIAGLRHAG